MHVCDSLVNQLHTRRSVYTCPPPPSPTPNQQHETTTTHNLRLRLLRTHCIPFSKILWSSRPPRVQPRMRTLPGTKRPALTKRHRTSPFHILSTYSSTDVHSYMSLMFRDPPPPPRLDERGEPETCSPPHPHTKERKTLDKQQKQRRWRGPSCCWPRTEAFWPGISRDGNSGKRTCLPAYIFKAA